ncbi:MAG: amidohydrolase [Corynebacterium sp.]|uniref:amidohydrolase n=1 Tax=Corynebacterium sp. TaxID=1720 RepID=UPI0026E11053|nr:amidohydrolase [Corynebacterium sp.]MDO5670259.1 amidohydrolase [Corynebacterium sp.]
MYEFLAADLNATRRAREDLYRWLHQNPELSGAEHVTSQRIVEVLIDAGLHPVRIGRTGVLVVVDNGEGPVVAARADIDALPVEEASGKEYAATGPVSHACGHDVHIASLLGAVDFMHRHREAWSGTFVGVFQPAEETASGARQMLDDGLAEQMPRPDVYLGQHVLATVPGGHVGTVAGPVLSAGGSVKVTVHGRGSHGSMPEKSVDPVVLAAAIVMRLQTIVAREVGPRETAVVTVGAVHAGVKSNVIADRAELLLNIRAYDGGVEKQLRAAIERIVRAECAASASPQEPEFEWYDSYPLTSNDPDATARVRGAFDEFFGERAVDMEPVSASEDFSVIPDSLGVPYCYWGLGGFIDPDSAPGNHHPAFAPDLQPTLDSGVAAIVVAASAWLNHINPPE